MAQVRRGAILLRCVGTSRPRPGRVHPRFGSPPPLASLGRVDAPRQQARSPHMPLVPRPAQAPCLPHQPRRDPKDPRLAPPAARSAAAGPGPRLAGHRAGSSISLRPVAAHPLLRDRLVPPRFHSHSVGPGSGSGACWDPSSRVLQSIPRSLGAGLGTSSGSGGPSAVARTGRLDVVDRLGQCGSACLPSCLFGLLFCSLVVVAVRRRADGTGCGPRRGAMGHSRCR